MALIIYAEDDDIVGELVQNTLIDAGHALGVVGDGKDALRLVKARKPDLLILDIGLPGMSGSEVLDAIRRDPQAYNLPILILTARRGAEDEAIARWAGATEYLRKPFDPDELVAIVDRLLKARAPGDSEAKAPPRRV
jgi:DNA-binding response OmpR family regulator